MTAISLGDLARTFLLRRQNAALKVDQQRLSSEVVTGQTADVRGRVNGDFNALGGLDRSLTMLAARKSVTTETALVASAMQTAVGAITTSASELSGDLLAYGKNGTAKTVDQLGADAEEAFRTAIATLNGSSGGRALFAGTQIKQAALKDADTILGSLAAAISSATSVADVETMVSDWFDDPAGYGDAYTGGPPLAPIPVSGTDTVDLGITAADPAIRETLKGLAMAAMIHRGALGGSDTARGDLAVAAGRHLLESQGSRADLASRIGRAEERIEAVATANAAEATTLQIARTTMLEADGYETATKLEATQTQIETLYSLTSRLSRMSLVDYL